MEVELPPPPPAPPALDQEWQLLMNQWVLSHPPLRKTFVPSNYENNYAPFFLVEPEVFLGRPQFFVKFDLSTRTLKLECRIPAGSGEGLDRWRYDLKFTRTRGDRRRRMRERNCGRRVVYFESSIPASAKRHIEFGEEEANSVLSCKIKLYRYHHRNEDLPCLPQHQRQQQVQLHQEELFPPESEALSEVVPLQPSLCEDSNAGEN